MSVIGLDAVLHHQCPKAVNGHFLPDVGGAILRLGIVDRFEEFILLVPGKHLKSAAVRLRRHVLDGFQAQPIGVAVRRHLGEAVSRSAAFVQALVDTRHERNTARGHPVVLRQEMGNNRLQQPRLFGSEKSNRRNLMNAIQNLAPGRLVPESLLGERAEPGVVAGLFPLRQGPALGVKRSPVGEIAGILHGSCFRSRRIRHANNPKTPQAAKSSGAKSGGP